ncbi:hypothetical protein V5T82_03240 [Magnetovibrio sp. PR-2]|uniref:hypothetical protein n=1 Tax=Magnetovibrio sp. PR-2 TaxID=3120356 RepID=UPI002FCE0223
MLRFVVFLMAMVTFSGVLVLAVLTIPMGIDMFMGIAGAVGLGTVVSIPVSFMVAKAMEGK